MKRKDFGCSRNAKEKFKKAMLLSRVSAKAEEK